MSARPWIAIFVLALVLDVLAAVPLVRLTDDGGEARPGRSTVDEADRPVAPSTVPATTSAPPVTGTPSTVPRPPAVSSPAVPSPAARPAAVRIPVLGVEASLVELRLQADGSLEAPADYQQAGWYVHGPRPGDRGAAVVAAHVDSKTGPAPFHRLGTLGPGTDVIVDYDDGTSVAFTTTRTEQHPKDAFPTGAVYGRTTGAELRLITCGGAFDRDRGHYVDNVVVWAVAGPAR
jgi:hypothetical protein